MSIPPCAGWMFCRSCGSQVVAPTTISAVPLNAHERECLQGTWPLLCPLVPRALWRRASGGSWASAGQPDEIKVQPSVPLPAGRKGMGQRTLPQTEIVARTQRTLAGCLWFSRGGDNGLSPKDTIKLVKGQEDKKVDFLKSLAHGSMSQLKTRARRRPSPVTVWGQGQAYR